MKIWLLEIRDFMGIQQASITPKKINIISGKNASGKSSILKAIKAVFEGATPAEIRQGSDTAEILIDLQEIRIARRITAKGQRVKVTNAEGFERPAPQTYLSSLLGTIAFNPLTFYAAKKADRTKMLLEAVGQTVTAEDIIEACGEVVPGLPVKGPALLMYDIAHKHFYSARHAKNKELLHARELAKAAREKVPEGYDPDPSIDEKEKAVEKRREVLGKKVATLQAEKQAAERAEATRTKITERIRKNTEILEQAKFTLAEEKVPDVAGLRKTVEDLRIQLRAAENALQAGTAIAANINRLKGDVASMERDIVQDQEMLSELPGAFDEARLQEAEEESVGLLKEATAIEVDKDRRKLYEEADQSEADRNALQQEADALDEKVLLFRDVLPATSLSEAKLPIEGLRIEGDDVTVNGIPIDNRSGAEKMQLSLSIARALAAECPLKMICVDGIEQLDEESLAAFEAEAEKDEFQYFGTRVGKPREGEVEVKEGRVVAQ